MKPKQLRKLTIPLLIFGLVSCGTKKEAATASTADVMKGVAATGAPISNGKVDIKGSAGKKVSTTTSSTGAYSSDISTLAEPFLVRVIAPNGAKLITVASKSALVAGKKINITPLSHMIVANVFKESDADTLFNDYKNQADEYSDSALNTQKNALVKKLKEAGLIGSGKIVDETVDLLNGNLQAGTSNGLDGLMDVIDVDISTTPKTAIKIKLKGKNTPIIVDEVDGITDDTTTLISSADLTQAKAELTTIGALRTTLSNFAKTYSSYKNCKGKSIVDDGGPCDIDTIVTAFEPYMHPNWADQGKKGSATIAAYNWVCGEDLSIVDKASCLSANKKYEFQGVTFTDVSLISYDSSTTIAHINFNLYLNGSYRGLQDLRLQKDSGTFKVIGGEQTFGYWMDAKSIHKTTYKKSDKSSTDSYGVFLKMQMRSDNSSWPTVGAKTFTAASGNNIFGDGTSSTTTIYVVNGPVYDDSGNCSNHVVFSATDKPWISSTDGTATAASCATGSSCSCDSHYFD